MIGSGDNVDRAAPNPNRVTQPFDRIGKGSEMSELEATERYHWSKIRLDLKAGMVMRALDELRVAERTQAGLSRALSMRIAKTFTAGCIALGDPAPTDKEQTND